MKKQNSPSKNSSKDTPHTFKQKIVPNYLKLKFKIPFIFEITALWTRKKI